MGCGGSKAVDRDEDGEGGAPEVPKSKNAVSCSGEGLTELPKCGAKTDSIDCSENQLTALPDWIGDLQQLKTLDANANALTTLPETIVGCANLEKLYVYKNKLKELPAKLPPQLTEINCFNNQIRKLPPSIGELSCLEEVNFSSNKLMMTTDVMFTSWATVKVLNMYENNLVRFGSLAPLVALEELRLNGNNLEEMPALGSHPELTIIEVHKNRIATIPEDYFKSTPALARLSIWGNSLTALPLSLCSCEGLLGAQVQQNQLTGLPTGLPWPPKLETLFIQENPAITTLPAELKACLAMRRCNVSKTGIAGEGAAVADAIKDICLKNDGGIFWDVTGLKHSK